MLPPELSVLAARQAFPDAQAVLTGAANRLGLVSVGWYGTDVHDERGSFAVVNPLGAAFSTVGSYVQLSASGRSVTVYVVGSLAGLKTQVAVTRRSFMALGLLSESSLVAAIHVLT